MTLRVLSSRESHTRPLATRCLVKWLWRGSPSSTLAEAVALQKRSYEKAVVVVRAYYALSVLWVVLSLNTWPQYSRLEQATPLWPTSWWFNRVHVGTGVDMIFAGYLVATLVVLLVPEQRWARLAYAFVLLQHMAFTNGFDKINHDFHAWLFVSVVFVLLPKGPWNTPRRISDRQYFLTVFWAAQLVVLLFYSLTGAWKVSIALDAIVDGRISGLNLSGFSYVVGENLLRTNPDTVLGEFFVRNELAGWLLFVGTMYLETFSIFIAFRPRLQRPWGLGLIAFHIGTQLAMGFTFAPNIVLLGILLVCSPFAPDRIRVKDALTDLPVIYLMTRRYQALRHRAGTRGKPVTAAVP